MEAVVCCQSIARDKGRGLGLAVSIPQASHGVGEVGSIGVPPAVINAVLDALAPRGVTTLEMPATPERVWRALRDAAA